MSLSSLVWNEQEIIKVDDEDSDLLNEFKWRIGNHGYAITTIRPEGKSVPVLLHQLIVFKITGIAKFPRGYCIRHLNDNKLDNRRGNLKVGTVRDNGYDMVTNKGIVKSPQKTRKQSYQMCFCYKGKTHNLGSYDSREDALLAKQRFLLQEGVPIDENHLIFDDLRLIKSSKDCQTSRYRGVRKFKDKYLARIRKNGVEIYRAIFDDELSAHEALQDFRAKLND